MKLIGKLTEKNLEKLLKNFAPLSDVDTSHPNYKKYFEIHNFSKGKPIIKTRKKKPNAKL